MFENINIKSKATKMKEKNYNKNNDKHVLSHPRAVYFRAPTRLFRFLYILKFQFSLIFIACSAESYINRRISQGRLFVTLTVREHNTSYLI